MKLLALETSTQHLSVVFTDAGGCLVRRETIANGGSERILPWVHELLAEAGLSLSQLDGIAFGAGPGGFTGLRLACGVAQGLAWGADLPVLGICTLEAMAAQAEAPRVFACLDARMGEVYVAAYERIAADEYRCLLPPAVSPPILLKVPPGEWLAVGDGLSVYADVLNRLFSQTRPDIFPDATILIRLAQPRFMRGEGQPAIMAAPLYVRDKVALTTAERIAGGGRK